MQGLSFTRMILLSYLDRQKSTLDIVLPNHSLKKWVLHEFFSGLLFIQFVWWRIKCLNAKKFIYFLARQKVMEKIFWRKGEICSIDACHFIWLHYKSLRFILLHYKSLWIALFPGFRENVAHICFSANILGTLLAFILR